MPSGLKMNEMAARGFEAQADAYEKGRPEYPRDAMENLIRVFGINPQTHLIDLGAGTGKLTRLLVPTQATIIAVEPVEGMRKKFSSVLPSVKVVEGSADRIPVEDQSVDVVLVAQAFHWFAGESTLKEIYRVLKPRGGLGLVWNVRDESVDWVAQLTKMIDHYANHTPRYTTLEWKKAFDQSVLFTPLERKQFSFVQKGDVETIVNRVQSISFIGALPKEHRQKLLGQVRKLLEEHPQTQGLVEMGIPYLTDVYTCFKK